MLHLRLLAVIVIALCATRVKAQEFPELWCEPGDAPCATAREHRLLQLFGVPSIEAHRDRGDQVRRIFILNHHGMPVAAISFVRSSGARARAFMYFPRRRGEIQQPLQAPLSSSFWRDVLERSRRLDTPAFTADDAEDGLICLDGWTRVVEASDPASESGRLTVRRAIVEDCRSSPASEFALAMEQAVIPLFPFCRRAESIGIYGPVGTCGRLYGDRMAAADALNQALEFFDPRGRDLIAFFAPDARIDWDGDTAPRGSRGAADFWRARDPLVDSERFEGMSANRVRLTGYVFRYVDVPANSEQTFDEAPLEMLWVRDPGDTFRIARITVGAWSRRR